VKRCQRTARRVRAHGLQQRAGKNRSDGSRKKKPPHVLIISGDVVGAGEFFGREAGGESDAGHAGHFGGPDAVCAVFDDAAGRGSNAQFSGGGEVDFGIGFRKPDIFAGNDELEVRTESRNLHDDIGHVMVGAGGDGELVALREFGNQACNPLKTGRRSRR